MFELINLLETVYRTSLAELEASFRQYTMDAQEVFRVRQTVSYKFRRIVVFLE